MDSIFLNEKRNSFLHRPIELCIVLQKGLCIKIERFLYISDSVHFHWWFRAYFGICALSEFQNSKLTWQLGVFNAPLNFQSNVDKMLYSTYCSRIFYFYFISIPQRENQIIIECIIQWKIRKVVFFFSKHGNKMQSRQLNINGKKCIACMLENL